MTHFKHLNKLGPWQCVPHYSRCCWDPWISSRFPFTSHLSGMWANRAYAWGLWMRLLCSHDLLSLLRSFFGSSKFSPVHLPCSGQVPALPTSGESVNPMYPLMPVRAHDSVSGRIPCLCVPLFTMVVPVFPECLLVGPAGFYFCVHLHHR